MNATELRLEIDGLGGAEWTTWPHAYGSARDTPGHLAALLGDDEQAQVAAARHFGSAIVHQSSIWPASPDAFAWLIRVLRVQPPPVEVLGSCLSALAEAGENVEDDDPAELSEEGRKWLARFATTPDEDHELVWDDFLVSGADEDVYRWLMTRMAALRPEVAALLEALDGVATAAMLDDVRRSWLP